MSKVIAIDVDLTVVDTYTPWVSQIEALSGKKLKNESGVYDLVPEMREMLKGTPSENLDPFVFWKDPFLYDNLYPLPFCTWTVKNMIAAGNRVVFVSSCVPEHTDSKIRFLKKWFPGYHGFLATHDKHFVDYDVLIDDKRHHIVEGIKHRPDARHILFTEVREDGNPETNAGLEVLSKWCWLDPYRL